jgi:hypothetical protein
MIGRTGDVGGWLSKYSSDSVPSGGEGGTEPGKASVRGERPNMKGSTCSVSSSLIFAKDDATVCMLLDSVESDEAGDPASSRASEIMASTLANEADDVRRRYEGRRWVECTVDRMKALSAAAIAPKQILWAHVARSNAAQLACL